MVTHRDDDTSQAINPLDNPHSSGIDPDMTWLVGLGVEDPGDSLTAVQKRAATLLAEILQPERVDMILHLGKGTVRGWAGDETFREEARKHRRFLASRVDAPTYEAALTPAQRRGAYLEACGAKKVEVAKVVGRDRSTLNNWSHDPIYRRLRERYEGELRGERTRESQRRQEEELQLAHRAISNGLRFADPEVAGKLAVTVVKMYGEHGGKSL